VSDSKLYVARNQIVRPWAGNVYLPAASKLSRDASAHYDEGLEKFTTGSINLGTGSGGDVIRVRLLRTSAYTFSQAHEFASSLPSAIVSDVTLGSKALVGGTFDAGDAVFASVPAGAAIDSLAILKWVTADADSPLIAYIDGFTVTPNGGDITIQWQATSPFIFKI
jgi:hypothetical protein